MVSRIFSLFMMTKCCPYDMSDVGEIRNPPDLVHSITLNETEKRWHADILHTLFESFTVTSFNYKIGNDFCIERDLDTDITKVKSRCVSTVKPLKMDIP